MKLNTPVGENFPALDMWNHRYALRVLAHHLGLSDVRLRFVPESPFKADPDDPRPYFLPCGTNGEPWLAPLAEKTPREILDSIARAQARFYGDERAGWQIEGEWHPDQEAPGDGGALVFGGR